MISRYRVNISGTQMDSLDDNLLILDVSYTPVEKQIRELTIAGLDGYDVGDVYYSRRIITITFELHIYDIAERNAVCQKVNAWAQSGNTLRINDRAGQMIGVYVQQFADIASARNWTDPLTLVFVATNNPFWTSTEEKTVTITGRSAKGTLRMDGNTENALVSVTVTPKALLSSLQITVGDTMLKLTGLSVAANHQVVIDYVRGRYLRIMADGVSLMNKLDPSSNDNLKAKCGANTQCSIVANNSVTAVFTARGLWL